MLKTWKEKLSVVFALALVICSFPLTAMAEEAAAPIGKGEILEYSLDPESAKAEETKTVSQGYTKGASLGTFQIVGYSGGGLTYSGAPTQANHTIAVFVGDTVYTVEDIGSAVKGKMIDIYFSTMDEARALTRAGRVYREVFVAVPAK